MVNSFTLSEKYLTPLLYCIRSRNIANAHMPILSRSVLSTLVRQRFCHVFVMSCLRVLISDQLTKCRDKSVRAMTANVDGYGELWTVIDYFSMFDIVTP